MHELNKDLKSKGQFVAAEGLVAPDQARIVKANDDGSPSVTDGPFAESKEFIAGFWMVDVRMPMRRIALPPAPRRSPVQAAMPCEHADRSTTGRLRPPQGP
jgi:hypothetical protein